MEVKVNNQAVVVSPQELIDVKSDAIFAPNCVFDDQPAIVYAGLEYSFKIQGRDQYHNNIKDFLSGVGDNAAFLTSVLDSAVFFAGTVSDDLDFPDGGIYSVDFTVPKA